MAFFVIFCFETCAKMPIFSALFEKTAKNLPKKAPPKNDNFSHFAKHRFIKNTVMLQPPFWPKIGVFELGFLKPKVLNNKHNSKSGKKKDKKKRFQRENKTGNQKRITHSLKTKKLQFYIFMLFYSWNKSKEERTMKKETKTRNKKNAQEERQEGRKKDKRKRETEKKKQKRGRPKKVKGGRKRNTENKPKNAPFRGKNKVFLLKQRKERNQKENKKQQKKQIKKQIKRRV